MKKRRALLVLALAAALPAAHAQPAKWPERPVRTIVPFAPGGATDVVARMFAPEVTLIHPVYPKSTGQDAVGRFFTEYIPSRFPQYFEYSPNVIVEDNQAAAEWIFEVTRLDGQPATLTGITVLEFDGARIRSIKIFTDPTQLGGGTA